MKVTVRGKPTLQCTTSMCLVQQKLESDYYAQKGTMKIKFDIVFTTPHEVIYECYFHHGHELRAVATERRKVISVLHMHKHEKTKLQNILVRVLRII